MTCVSRLERRFVGMTGDNPLTAAPLNFWSSPVYLIGMMFAKVIPAGKRPSYFFWEGSVRGMISTHTHSCGEPYEQY